MFWKQKLRIWSTYSTLWYLSRTMHDQTLHCVCAYVCQEIQSVSLSLCVSAVCVRVSIYVCHCPGNGPVM